MNKNFIVNGYDCAGNNIYCSVWGTLEDAQNNIKYIHSTNKQREKLTRSKIVKTKIIEEG